MMKAAFLLGASLCLASAAWSKPRESVPRKWGLYLADVSSGRVRLLGDYYDWKASPDGRFIVAGRVTGTSHYEVSLLSTSTGSARRLERFRLEEPGGAAFRWSSDSASVRVEADRDNDQKSDFKTFKVGRASTSRRSLARVLSSSTRKKLKARYGQVEEVAFSPDGQRVVAYLARDNRNLDGGYWLLRPDGSALRRLTRNTVYTKGDFQDREIVWLDNQRVAFRRTSFDDEGI